MEKASEIIEALGYRSSDPDFEVFCQELRDAANGSDFTYEIGKRAYRFIHEDSIERIHRDEIEELVDDCYLSDKNVPDAIKRYFDYDSFARDCRISDGYGHHFATYDGEEIEEGDWHIFRVN